MMTAMKNFKCDRRGRSKKFDIFSSTSRFQDLSDLKNFYRDRSARLIDDINGYTSGEFTGNDEIQLTHIDDAQPYSAALDTLKKV